MLAEWTGLYDDVLTFDTVALDDEEGYVSAKLVTYLFAPRNAIDSGEAYRQLRGREADISAISVWVRIPSCDCDWPCLQGALEHTNENRDLERKLYQGTIGHCAGRVGHN